MANWRIESLGRDSESQSDEEFFDCEGKTIFFSRISHIQPRYLFSPDMIDSSLAKWSSMDLLNEEDPDAQPSSMVQVENEGRVLKMSFSF